MRRWAAPHSVGDCDSGPAVSLPQSCFPIFCSVDNDMDPSQRQWANVRSGNRPLALAWSNKSCRVSDREPSGSRKTQVYSCSGPGLEALHSPWGAWGCPGRCRASYPWLANKLNWCFCSYNPEDSCKPSTLLPSKEMHYLFLKDPINSRKYIVESNLKI